MAPNVHIEPWSSADRGLLDRCLGDPAMMRDLGGPESAEALDRRQRRYARRDSRQYKIVDDASGAGVGWVGYWRRTWHRERVWEIGWAVVPEFQGRGIARTGAGQVIALARSEGERRFLHSYPSVANAPSNAICRHLGFTLLREIELEYPPGHHMLCNDWLLDLHPSV
jgi:RimJ/RimL family protein N-acetyltransferase